MSASLQDIEIQYHFSWFCRNKFGSQCLHSSLHIIKHFASCAIGLCFTVCGEKDTGTLTGLSFCNPESWFQSVDISWQIMLHVHSHHNQGDHVSSAIEVPLSRGWKLIDKNLLCLNNIFFIFLKLDHFSFTTYINKCIYNKMAYHRPRANFFKCLAYDCINNGMYSDKLQNLNIKTS